MCLYRLFSANMPLRKLFAFLWPRTLLLRPAPPQKRSAFPRSRALEQFAFAKKKAAWALQIECPGGRLFKTRAPPWFPTDSASRTLCRYHNGNHVPLQALFHYFCNFFVRSMSFVLNFFRGFLHPMHPAGLPLKSCAQILHKFFRKIFRKISKNQLPFSQKCAILSRLAGMLELADRLD